MRPVLSESWRPVPGFVGCYEVSDQGRVRSCSRLVRSRGGVRMLKGRVLKPGRTRQYLYVCLPPKRIAVHRLVLLAFVGAPPAGTYACHNNGDSLDNRLANLRWDTVGANIADAVRHGSWNSDRRLAHLRRMNEARRG